ncbi:MAG TPA: hypothetical protein VIU83_03310, partial [Candidatus Deferrimicrobium sp.]
YGKMLLGWKEEITAKENAIAVALEEAKGHVDRSRKMGAKVDEAEKLVKEAEANYLAVSNGRGTHNYRLSKELLAAAQASIDKVLKEKKK